MWNLFSTIFLGTIIYFFYGSLVFWSLGCALAVFFISMMFIDIDLEDEVINS